MKTIKGALFAAASSVALACAMAAPASAIPFRDDVGDEGAQAFAEGWDGVVQIYLWNRVSGSITFNCTGSMINPRTVISAAHCFDANPEFVYADGPGSLTPIIAFGPDTFVPLLNWINNDIQFTDDLNGLTFGVDLMMHPDSPVNGVTDFPAADVAMIALANPLYTLPTYGMLFSPIPEDVFNEGVLVNQIGYGTFHPGSDSSVSSINGRRRAGENMLGLMASQSDFFQALARNEGAGSGAPADNQLLYWTDFDLPGRTGTCERTNLGPTGEDSIFCDDNVPFDGVRLDGDTVVLPGPSIDYFPGDALPNEVATAGGDSGGPLMAMNIFNNPLLLGVLSGGFVDGFFHSSGQSYGEVSYYNPLFTYHQWISENNPYKYVSAMAGDGDWSDPTHWVQGLDPNYFVYNADGEIVNGLPDGDEGGLGQRRPTAGVVFDTPVSEFDTLDEPGAVTPVGAPATIARNFAASGLVADGVLRDDSADGLVASVSGSTDVARSVVAPQTGSATQTVSGLTQTLTGPGYTGFVPDNFYGTPNAAAFVDPAQFFDVTLAAAGTTTLDLSSVEIDRLTIAGADAGLDILEGNFLASLIGVNILAGSLNVDGDLFTREVTLWNGVVSGSGAISLFDPNAFLGNGELLDGAFFNVGGVVAPGEVGGIGELSIAGDYVQSAAGALGIDWSADDVDVLAVSGDVSLDGFVLVNPVDGYVPTFGDSRRILTFSGERVGEFAGDNLPGVLYLDASYGASFVDVTIAARSFATEASFQNDVQSNIAARLDAARTSYYGGLSDLYNRIDLLSGDALTAAMENLAPHEHYQFRRSAEGHLGLFSDQMRSLALGLGASTGGGASGAAGFTANLMQADGRAPRLADASLALATETSASGPSINEVGEGWRVFGVVGQSNGTTATTTVSNSDLEADFGLVGFDYQVRDWLRLGGTLGYASSDAESVLVGGGSARSSVDTLQLGGYALAEKGALTAMATASHAMHETDSNRTAAVGGAAFNATGGQDGDTNTLSALLAYDLELHDRFTLTPTASLTWAETQFDAGNQTGSAAALALSESKTRELVSRLGIVASTHFNLGSVVFEPQAYWGSARNEAAQSERIDVSFVSAPGLVSVEGVPPGSSQWEEVSAGVVAHLENGLSLSLSYNHLNGRRDVLDMETLSVGARFRF